MLSRSTLFHKRRDAARCASGPPTQHDFWKQAIDFIQILSAVFLTNPEHSRMNP